MRSHFTLPHPTHTFSLPVSCGADPGIFFRAGGGGGVQVHLTGKNFDVLFFYYRVFNGVFFFSKVPDPRGGSSADPEGGGGGGGHRGSGPPWKITSYMGFYRE